MGEKKRMEEEKKRLRVKRRRPAVARNTFLRRGKSPTTTSQNPHLLASPSTWQVVGIFLNTESFFFSLSSGSYARQEWKATLTVCVPLQNQTQMFFCTKECVSVSHFRLVWLFWHSSSAGFPSLFLHWWSPWLGEYQVLFRQPCTCNWDVHYITVWCVQIASWRPKSVGGKIEC